MADILRQRVHRRDVLNGAGAIAALSLSTLPMPAVAQERTLKLGYISPKSGPLALFGQADEFVLRAHQSRWPPFWRTCRGYWQLNLANATVASGAGVGDGVACHWPAWT